MYCITASEQGGSSEALRRLIFRFHGIWYRKQSPGDDVVPLWQIAASASNDVLPLAQTAANRSCLRNKKISNFYSITKLNIALKPCPHQHIRVTQRSP